MIFDSVDFAINVHDECALPPPPLQHCMLHNLSRPFSCACIQKPLGHRHSPLRVALHWTVRINRLTAWPKLLTSMCTILPEFLHVASQHTVCASADCSLRANPRAFYHRVTAAHFLVSCCNDKCSIKSLPAQQEVRVPFIAHAGSPTPK